MSRVPCSISLWRGDSRFGMAAFLIYHSMVFWSKQAQNKGLAIVRSQMSDRSQDYRLIGHPQCS